MKHLTIAIIYSLPTKRAQQSSFLVADEDTVLSAQKIAAALTAKGATPLLVGLSEDRVQETIRSLHADLIFNLIDWTGKDLPLSLLSMDELVLKDIPFTGATRENFAYVDKVAMKKALERSHLPTPAWQIFHNGTEPVTAAFTYPVLVKLAHEHCSVGIEKSSLVANERDLVAVVRERLFRFGQDVFAEEFISGREFQITVLEQENGPVMLPVAEIIYKPSDSPEFLTFSERWDETDPDYMRSTTVLAALSKEQQHMFEQIALKTFRGLGFRDFTRIDARLRGNELLILEANPNPGLDDDELYSMTISARAAGFSFPDFLWAIVQSALRRVTKG